MAAQSKSNPAIGIGIAIAVALAIAAASGGHTTSPSPGGYSPGNVGGWLQGSNQQQNIMNGATSNQGAGTTADPGGDAGAGDGG